MTLSMKVENTKILLWHLTQFHLSIYKVETYLYAHDQIKEVTLTTIETDYNSLKFSPLFYVLDKNKITGMLYEDLIWSYLNLTVAQIWFKC